MSKRITPSFCTIRSTLRILSQSVSLAARINLFQKALRSLSVFPQHRIATPTLPPIIPRICARGRRLDPYFPGMCRSVFPETILHFSGVWGHLSQVAGGRRKPRPGCLSSSGISTLVALVAAYCLTDWCTGRLLYGRLLHIADCLADCCIAVWCTAGCCIADCLAADCCNACCCMAFRWILFCSFVHRCRGTAACCLPIAALHTCLSLYGTSDPGFVVSGSSGGFCPEYPPKYRREKIHVGCKRLLHFAFGHHHVWVLLARHSDTPEPSTIQAAVD